MNQLLQPSHVDVAPNLWWSITLAAIVSASRRAWLWFTSTWYDRSKKFLRLDRRLGVRILRGIPFINSQDYAKQVTSWGIRINETGSTWGGSALLLLKELPDADGGSNRPVGSWSSARAPTVGMASRSLVRDLRWFTATQGLDVMCSRFVSSLSDLPLLGSVWLGVTGSVCVKYGAGLRNVGRAGFDEQDECRSLCQ